MSTIWRDTGLCYDGIFTVVFHAESKLPRANILKALNIDAETRAAR